MADDAKTGNHPSPKPITYKLTPKRTTSCEECRSFMMNIIPPVYELLATETLKVLEAIYTPMSKQCLDAYSKAKYT
jgi:hypothetical protein